MLASSQKSIVDCLLIHCSFCYIIRVIVSIFIHSLIFLINSFVLAIEVVLLNPVASQDTVWPNWDISEICRMKIYLQNYCCGFLHGSYAGSQSCIYFHFTSSYAKWPKPHFQISTQLSSLRSARASLYELNQLMLICEWGRWKIDLLKLNYLQSSINIWWRFWLFSKNGTFL